MLAYLCMCDNWQGTLLKTFGLFNMLWVAEP